MEDHAVEENSDSSDEEEEEERIYVTRQEEEIDPEVEADFDREFEKMMVESLDSRKFERRTHFDVPLPIRKAQAGHHDAADDAHGEVAPVQEPLNTMSFSLMTKRGNRAQVGTAQRHPMLVSGSMLIIYRLERLNFPPTLALHYP